MSLPFVVVTHPSNGHSYGLGNGKWRQLTAADTLYLVALGAEQWSPDLNEWNALVDLFGTPA